jgi:hypothetical protein
MYAQTHVLHGKFKVVNDTTSYVDANGAEDEFGQEIVCSQQRLKAPDKRFSPRKV